MGRELKDLLLMQRLIDRLNSECVTMSYTMLADYLITNYNRLDSLTMEQLCREVFVSKSTVRRFCREMGYCNFTDLKKAKREIPAEEYPASFSIRQELIKALLDLPAPETSLGKLRALLDQSDAVFLMLPGSLLSVGHDFQRQMAERQRLIYLMPNVDRHFFLVQETLRSALVIVLDADREYTAALSKYLGRIQGKKVCIRAGDGTPVKEDWELVIQLGSGNTRVVTKYLYSFFLDAVTTGFRRSGKGSYYELQTAGHV